MQENVTMESIEDRLDWSRSGLLKIICRELDNLTDWPYQQEIIEIHELYHVPDNMREMLALANNLLREMKARSFFC